MAKLSKPQVKAHNQALEICEQDTLSYDEKLFVLENYHEAATNMNGFAGAFFTPLGLGRGFSMEVRSNKRVVDLCAGIGHLSYNIIRSAEIGGEKAEVTCIELNPEYYEIGKKILPEAKWINGDITDIDMWLEIFGGEDISNWKRFTCAISNPPFGNIRTGVNTFPLKYKGSNFELKTVEIASMVSECATFILPQMSTPYKYSGAGADRDGYYAKEGRSSKFDTFSKQTGIKFNFNMGIDATSDEWKGVNPVCEIVNWEGIHADDYEPELELF